MSVKVSSWVWHETPKELKGGKLLALLALADIADDEGNCVFAADTSQSAMADKARLSVSQFRAVTKDLVAEGYLEAGRESQRETKSYRIVMTAGNQRSEIGVTAGNQRRGSAVTPPKTGGHSSIDVTTYIAQFDAFWDVYPRHVAKAGAKAKFMALARGGADLAAVVDGARRYASDPNLPEPQFIPYPTTWLNQGRWEDDALPARGDRDNVIVGLFEPGQEWMAR